MSLGARLYNARSGVLSRAFWLLRSSALRLSLLLSLVFAVGMAAAIFVALTLGRDAIERRVDESLVTFAGATTLEEAEETSPVMILRAVDELTGLPRQFARAVERNGGNVELDRDYLRSDVWRVLVAEDAEGEVIMIAVPLEEADRAQELLAGVLWSTAGLVIALALAIGVGAGLLAQRRLHRINVTLGQLEAGNLTARTGQAKAKDDLGDIAQQLDRTASELERLVIQTRHLSASIAHDLRTPLARLRAQLEMLPHGHGRSAALEEASRLSSIFDTIMRVARIEAGHGRDGFETVDLGELAADMTETFGPVVEDGGKVLTFDLSAPKSVEADRAMLVQAVANLIQNALVHGGDHIRLFVRDRQLGVADNGPGVNPDQFAEILKPMVRLDAARTSDGSGLGLALVKAVADRHGAQLGLAVNEPQGLKVTMRFTEL